MHSRHSYVRVGSLENFKMVKVLVYFLDNLMTMQRKFLGCLGS